MNRHATPAVTVLLSIACAMALGGCKGELSASSAGPDTGSGGADAGGRIDSGIDVDGGGGDLDGGVGVDAGDRVDGGPRPPGAWRFFVAGDTRSDPARLEDNVRSMNELDPDAIACFNGGDIVADGMASQWDDHHAALAAGAPDPSVPMDPLGIVRQSRFRTDVSDWGPYVRYVGAIGNHDIHVSEWLTTWTDYLSGQSTLGHAASDGVWFTLVYDNALFIILDSEHSVATQTAWLEGVLTGPEAAAATWIFAFFHAPVYPCNYKSPFDSGLEWVELFETYGVDIAWVAHSHTYERTCPMIGGRCDPAGVIYLNTSGGGAGVRAVEPMKVDAASHGGRTDPYDCADILAAWQGDWYHFTHITIDGCRLTASSYPHDYHITGEAPFDTLSIDKCP